jgi:Gpi18-like mannosyltransferase
VTRSRWPLAGVLLTGGMIAIAVRVALLPTAGFRPDLDQFVIWVHDIATRGLGAAYRQDLSFPPVMTYIFAVLGGLDPAFRTATAAADPTLRVLMKLPATLADAGLAAGVAWSLRSRPGWAVAGALGILLHPAVLYLSAWWGQFESIYLLSALIAFLLAVSGRPIPAGVALAISLMTKPQALPFLVPFAAWVLGRYGVRTAVATALAGAITIGVLWLPFIAAGGPLDYLHNLAAYQGETFSVVSLRAWNVWWFLQEQVSGGFISDASRIAGPVTLRWIGLAMAGFGETLVFLAVLRRPTARGLALGLACATLVAFSLLTTMHERYAYGAVVFLALLLPERGPRLAWLAFGILFTLNLVAAIPATQELASIPVGGALGIAGSLGMLALTAVCLWLLLREPPIGAAGRSTGADPREPDRLPSQATTGISSMGRLPSE